MHSVRADWPLASAIALLANLYVQSLEFKFAAAESQ